MKEISKSHLSKKTWSGKNKEGTSSAALRKQFVSQEEKVRKIFLFLLSSELFNDPTSSDGEKIEMMGWTMKNDLGWGTVGACKLMALPSRQNR